MHTATTRQALTAAIILMGTIEMLILGGVSTASAQQPDGREVTLELSMDGAGNPTVIVSPETATIWRNAQGKVKKVVWVAMPDAQYGELYWELRWDPSKGGGSDNFFGNVDLPCGDSQIKVQPKPKPKIPYAQWPYMVTVYSCSNGAKGQELVTVDPRIRWDD
jgi:hypothetical protein